MNGRLRRVVGEFLMQGVDRSAGPMASEPPDPAVEEAWRLEIRRRLAAYERGEAVLHDADDVMAEAKRLAP